MKHIIRLFLFVFGLLLAFQSAAQPYFVATATINGNNLVYKIKPVNGSITCVWVDIEFFFRNPTSSPNAHNAFDDATIVVNTVNFAGVSIPYNGQNMQGFETDYNNYWFGTSFSVTPIQTYVQNQEYIVCTITLSSSPSSFDLELCHNTNFSPHYATLTDETGSERINTTGTCVFYGPGATVCDPNNCPISTPAINHILPLDGSLPVELVDFQARKYGDHVARLDWRTAVEINFEAFEIERLQGENYWAQIGKEPAKAVGGSGATYTFYDVNATQEEELYRLKMVDLDGTFEYSPIRLVRFGSDQTMRIVPNPATDVLYLQYGAEMAEGDLLVELYDWTGRIVLQKNMVVVPGSSGVLYLNDYRLPAGVYRFKAGAANGFLFSQSIVIPIF